MDSNDGSPEEASRDRRLGLCGGLEISLGGFKHLGNVFRTCIWGQNIGKDQNSYLWLFRCPWCQH